MHSVDKGRLRTLLAALLALLLTFGVAACEEDAEDPIEDDPVEEEEAPLDEEEELEEEEDPLDEEEPDEEEDPLEDEEED